MPKYLISFRKAEDAEPIEVDAGANMVQATKALNESRFAHVGVFDGKPLALNTDAVLSIEQILEPPKPPTLGYQGEREEGEAEDV